MQENNEFRDLVREGLTGRISRREMIRRGAALGVSASVMTYLLSTRSTLAQDATPTTGAVAPGSTAKAPAGLRTDLKGKKIAWIGPSATDPDLPWNKAVVALFTQTTGIEVNLIPGEQDTNDRLTKYNQALGAGSSDFDVIQIDVIWPGVLAEHALDLSQSLKDLAALHAPALIQNNTVDGKLVGIPWFTDAGLLFWRQDLLDKYGVSQPQTWADLETTAKTIQDGERAATPDFFGFVFQGKAYEGLTCNAVEWIISNGGGNIVESDGTVSVNNEQAAAALDRAHGWVKNISPEGVTTYNEPNSLNDFITGRAAFMRNWPYAWAASQDPTQSKISGKIGVGILPKGDGENARNADCLGGWQLMVTKYSKEPDAATEFVKFMCSPEIQTSFAIERSHLPTIASVYEDPSVAAASEFIPRLKDVFSSAAVRPSSVTGANYPEVSKEIWTAVNDVLAGNKSSGDALKSLESKIKDIMSGA